MITRSFLWKLKFGTSVQKQKKINAEDIAQALGFKSLLSCVAVELSCSGETGLPGRVCRCVNIMKRAYSYAPRRTSKGSGMNGGRSANGDLSRAIIDMKSSIEAFRSAATMQAKFTDSLEKWARHEANPAIRDVMGKIADIDRVRCELVRMAAKSQEQCMGVFKWIHSEQRVVEQAQKEVDRTTAAVARTATLSPVSCFCHKIALRAAL